jgi:hypothetical protein
LSKPVLVSAERGSEPITPDAVGAVALVGAVDREAAASAASAATALAAAPRAGLDPDFVAAVEADATREAPAYETSLAPVVATFTPAGSAVEHADPSSGADEAEEPAGEAGDLGETRGGAGAAAAGRNIVLIAVLAAVGLFLWTYAHRGTPSA